jgi:hypothetical protein
MLQNPDSRNAAETKFISVIDRHMKCGSLAFPEGLSSSIVSGLACDLIPGSGVLVEAVEKLPNPEAK